MQTTLASAILVSNASLPSARHRLEMKSYPSAWNARVQSKP
ncbi:MAG: hypothetical protein AB7T31_10120 [Gemmatimonadales bacterium]